VPEGDTIHRTATALRAALLEKVMTGFEAPRLQGHSPAIGAVIERVDSRGKHIEIGWDDGTILHTHMRMTGSWHLYRPGERWRGEPQRAGGHQVEG
jgi:endonuclease-8